MRLFKIKKSALKNKSYNSYIAEKLIPELEKQCASGLQEVYTSALINPAFSEQIAQYANELHLDEIPDDQKCAEYFFDQYIRIAPAGDETRWVDRNTPFNFDVGIQVWIRSQDVYLTIASGWGADEFVDYTKLDPGLTAVEHERSSLGEPNKVYDILHYGSFHKLDPSNRWKTVD